MKGANVIEVNHDRLSLSLNATATVLVMMIELADAASGYRLISALADADFDVKLGDLNRPWIAGGHLPIHAPPP